MDILTISIRNSKGQVTPGGLGRILLSIDQMYEAITDESIERYPNKEITSLSIRSIKNGSIIVEFVGDPLVFKTIQDVWDAILTNKEVKDLWSYLGSNVTWDAMKIGISGFFTFSIGFLGFRKKANQSIALSAHDLVKEAMEANCVIEIDGQGNTRIIPPSLYSDLHHELGLPLPPRNKRNKRYK